MTDHDRPDDVDPTGIDLTGTEHRVRRALDHIAATVEPDPRALDRIEEDHAMSRSLSQAQRWVLGGVAAVAGLLVVLVLVLDGLGDDDDDVETAASSTTSAETTTSTSTTTSSTTTTFSSEVDAFAVAFPSPDDSRRFDTAPAAARAYATDVLGFTEVEIGTLVEDGTDAGVVPISDRPEGPETRIAVERMGDGTWFVTGSATDDIVVETPVAGAALGTPFETTGRALAFEGTVDVLVLRQSSATPVGTGFVMGSGTPPAGPFEGRVFFGGQAPDVPGVLVYRELSAEDGHVVKATSFPVRLTDEEVPAPEVDDGCGDVDEVAGDETTDAEVRVVKVYFHCGTDFDEIVALRRTIPRDDPAILELTLDALLAGPSPAEADAGYTSAFPVAGGVLRSVIIDGGVATIDLSSEYATLPNASATILVVREQLYRTAAQFSSVAAVEVHFDGDCEAFATWSQSESCLITEGEFGPVE